MSRLTPYRDASWLVRGLLLLLVLVLSLALLPAEAEALSAKDIRGSCKTDYAKWKKRGGYGAFALATNGSCGFSWDNFSLDLARKGALSRCRGEGKGKGCKIVAENNNASEYINKRHTCQDAKGQTKIDACTWLIDSKRDKGEALAWDYNERGRAHDDGGKIDLAIADYSSAIKADRTYGWAYMNRARLERQKGQLELALADAEAAIKYYRTGGDDQRTEARNLVAEIHATLANNKSIATNKLCIQSLKPNKKEWDTRGVFVTHVEEAKRRGLTVEKCRVALDYPAKYNPFEVFTRDRLCYAALNGDGTAWLSSADGQLATAEAERRKLSIAECRRILRLDAVEAATASSKSSANDSLCRLSLSRDGSDWSTFSALRPYVELAKQKGLTVDLCRTTLGITGVLNKPVTYTDNDICSAAMNKAKTDWSASADSKAARAEAERRNLTAAKCLTLLGVLTDAGNQPVPPPESTITAVMGKRIALVIGNSDYHHIRRLANTRSDADLMARTLERAGFKVTRLFDVEQNAMKQAMLEFGRELRGGAEASLFYYAGHGVQVDGQNYLIPVEAAIQDETEIAIQAIEVNSFLQTMESSPSQIKIVVLDACRDNPFDASFRNLTRGLASVDAPRGTYIAYSTAPGKVAYDGGGSNSPYTAALAEFILTPGLKLEDVFKRTRMKVLNSTHDRQLPWETSSLVGDFYFVPP